MLHQKHFSTFQTAYRLQLYSYAMTQGHSRCKLLLLLKEQMQTHMQQGDHGATHSKKLSGWPHPHSFVSSP
jgi:hypothetical protein